MDGLTMTKLAIKIMRLMMVSVAALLSACYQVSFEDVSAEPPYASHIGKHYRSEKAVYIYRVSMHPDYKAEPSHYILHAIQVYSGPEVLSHAKLPAGTTLKVLKMLRCRNCFLDFEDRVEAQVRLISTTDFGDREVRVSAKLLDTEFKQSDD
jgi:hypothetical protein